MEMPNDNQWKESNGVRERWTFIGIVCAIIATVAGLYFVFSTVDPLALAVLAVFIAALVYVVFRATRTATRDHDAEVVQAGMQGMQAALAMVNQMMLAQQGVQITKPTRAQLAPPVKDVLRLTAPNRMELGAAEGTLDSQDDGLPKPGTLLTFAALLSRGQQPTMRNADALGLTDHDEYTRGKRYLTESEWIAPSGEGQATRWAAGVVENGADNVERIRAHARELAQ